MTALDVVTGAAETAFVRLGEADPDATADVTEAAAFSLDDASEPSPGITDGASAAVGADTSGVLDEADGRTTTVVVDPTLRLVEGTGAAVTVSAPSSAAFSSIAEDTSEALDEAGDGATPTVVESSALSLDDPPIPMPGEVGAASIAEAAPEALETPDGDDSVVAGNSAFFVDGAFITLPGVTASAGIAAVAEAGPEVLREGGDCRTIAAGDPACSIEGGTSAAFTSSADPRAAAFSATEAAPAVAEEGGPADSATSAAESVLATGEGEPVCDAPASIDAPSAAPGEPAASVRAGISLDASPVSRAGSAGALPAGSWSGCGSQSMSIPPKVSASPSSSSQSTSKRRSMGS